MDIKDMPKLLLKNYSRIANLIPNTKLTLVTGLPGTGKTYSIIKFLNQEKITPIFLNLDESDIGNLSADMYGEDLIKPLLNKKITGFEGKVVIFDTYQRIVDMLNLDTKNESTNKQIVTAFEELAEVCTVIVIAHPEDYVGKDSIFKDNPILIRNCFEHIHFDSILPRGKTEADIVYRMFIKKGRGIGGTKIITNWLRD